MEAMVTLSSKGQIVIPASIRARLRLKQGDRLEVDVDDAGRVRLAPVPGLRELSASISGYARDVEPVTDAGEYYQLHRGQRT